jgi:hypothetical protein
MVSFGRAIVVIAHERASLLSSGLKERPMSILEGEEGIILSIANWPTGLNFSYFSYMNVLSSMEAHEQTNSVKKNM